MCSGEASLALDNVGLAAKSLLSRPRGGNINTQSNGATHQGGISASCSHNVILTDFSPVHQRSGQDILDITGMGIYGGPRLRQPRGAFMGHVGWQRDFRGGRTWNGPFCC